MPRAILLDLDDTILDDTSRVTECRVDACAAHADRLAPHDAARVVEAIRRASRWFWSDAERHRTGRLELAAARRHVVALAFRDLGLDDRALADSIGDTYTHHRETGMEPLPEAVDTVRWLRESGRRLALLTNGAGDAQRRKIERFGLAGLFDAILVEGDLGFGKPDERVYRRALEALGADPCDTWMVGDNLEWDVRAPQQLGMCGVWVDAPGRGLPPGSQVRPDRIIRSLSELRALIPPTV